MFYEQLLFRRDTSSDAKLESAIVTLNPAESKRLIAKAVAVLPEIKAVLQKGTLVISWGTTNAFVVEETLKVPITNKTEYASGVISGGELNANYSDTQIPRFMLQDGKPVEKYQAAALADFKPGDVFIKGANALDTKGDIGILVANPVGGSTRDAWFGVTARGGCFICPVGLEKLVPSVSEVAQRFNMFCFKYSMGLPVSLVTYSTAKVVTEIQAIRVLSGADAYHVASGGIGGSEGAITLVLEGETDTLERAFELVKSVKGEPPLLQPKQYKNPPSATVNYAPAALAETV